MPYVYIHRFIDIYYYLRYSDVMYTSIVLIERGKDFFFLVQYFQSSFADPEGPEPIMNIRLRILAVQIQSKIAIFFFIFFIRFQLFGLNFFTYSSVAKVYNMYIYIYVFKFRLCFHQLWESGSVLFWHDPDLDLTPYLFIVKNIPSK